MNKILFEIGKLNSEANINTQVQKFLMVYWLSDHVKKYQVLQNRETFSKYWSLHKIHECALHLTTKEKHIYFFCVMRNKIWWVGGLVNCHHTISKAQCMFNKGHVDLACVLTCAKVIRQSIGLFACPVSLWSLLTKHSVAVCEAAFNLKLIYVLVDNHMMRIYLLLLIRI